jgi:hypothetical protein
MRKWIWVAGPPLAGKTTFACRLIKSYRSKRFDVFSLRTDETSEDKKLRRLGENDGEKRTYYNAGAGSVEVYVVPPDRAYEAIDEYMKLNLLFGENNDLIFEGQTVGEYLSTDITVFVMPVHIKGDDPYPLIPLRVPEFESLLEMEKEDSAELEEEQSWVEEEVLDEEDEGEIIAELSEAQAKQLAFKLAGVVLENRPRPEYEFLRRAKVVVINYREEDRKEDLAYTRSRVEKILEDRERRASVHVCDLSEPKDPELKKAIARVKRLV